ncbi:15-hydroxyprostaglandin dehydrogenase [Lichtheimia corymbifera JMRC:FSU:9682]|uniref:15-hydroxyprostaglandin dehydrogenase n=1 Tax=Lichtheimia corymbifera JMRC:FSU:9682 TaxID=1263082 RepID=A0A068SFV9_9FUNG|nr:15-hydroxyprostaglandin dehydrogenase [Lichtheimia corymbifera JMRC:FSU:9682]
MATFDINSRVAVVTGASRGIGKAVSKALVEQGARVVIGDLLDKEGLQTVQELNSSRNEKVAAFIHTDVTVYKDVIALFRFAESVFGGVDDKISAGDGNPHVMVDDKEAELPNTNFLGIVKSTKVAVLHLAKRGGGVIVNMASTAGFQSCMQQAHYFATKHAVVGWTRSISSMLKEICNVRVNAVCPSWVDTEMHKMYANEEGSNPYKILVQNSPCADIETVVRGVMILIQDTTMNGSSIIE